MEFRELEKKKLRRNRLWPI